MLSHLGLIVLPAIQGMSAIWDVHYCEDSLYKVIKKRKDIGKYENGTLWQSRNLCLPVCDPQSNLPI